MFSQVICIKLMFADIVSLYFTRRIVISGTSLLNDHRVTKFPAKPTTNWEKYEEKIPVSFRIF